MAHRPFTRAQRDQNRRFLAALEATGNARLAARRLGVHRSTYLKRRARCPAFAARWDMALVAAQARLSRERDLQSRSSRAKSRGAPSAAGARQSSASCTRDLRTKGGEPVIVRRKNGRLQLRLAPPGRMTKAAEQAFLAALSASANIRLSAAAAGFSHASFYARARANRAFAREMRLALEMGYDRLQLAALVAADPASGEDDAWRSNDPPPIPPMTPQQALQLLHLHEKSVRQGWERPHRRKRRGEPWDTYTLRLGAMAAAERRRDEEAAALRAALQAEGETDPPRACSGRPVLSEVEGGTAKRARGSRGSAGTKDGAGVPPLPALDQVTGWSKAKGKPPHNPNLAMFGGWRIEDWKKGE